MNQELPLCAHCGEEHPAPDRWGFILVNVPGGTTGGLIWAVLVCGSKVGIDDVLYTLGVSVILSTGMAAFSRWLPTVDQSLMCFLKLGLIGVLLGAARIVLFG
jgi:hypothetical protein